MTDLAEKEPATLAQMKSLFLKEAELEGVSGLGAGLWTRLHPEDRVTGPYRTGPSTAARPACRSSLHQDWGVQSNRVVLDIEVGAQPPGVLYDSVAWRRAVPLRGPGVSRRCNTT